VVLLHGFPASSFMFRNLIPLLAGEYHVIAPDYLGFGLSDAPPAQPRWVRRPLAPMAQWNDRP
jgi:pimeloyl-ACP methyl ester carboxylesterase